jgi:hypothetical protein
MPAGFPPSYVLEVGLQPYGSFRELLINEAYVQGVWPLAEIGLDSPIRDISGHDHHGTYNGVNDPANRGVPVALPEGALGMFFGSQSWITVPDHPDLRLGGGSVDIIFVVKTHYIPEAGSVNYIVSKGPLDWSSGYQVWVERGEWDYGDGAGPVPAAFIGAIVAGSPQGATTDRPLPLNTWNLVHVIYLPERATFWVLLNGQSVLLDTGTWPDPIESSAPLYIGGRPSDPNQSFVGNLAMVMVGREGNPDLSPKLQATRQWTSIAADTRSSVAPLTWRKGIIGSSLLDNVAQPGAMTFALDNTGSMYEQRIRADGACAYWRLNETSGTTAKDSSGRNLTASYGSGVTLGVASPIEGTAAYRATAGTVITHADNVSLDLTSLSLEAWIYLTTLHTGYAMHLFDKGGAGGPAANYNFYFFGALGTGVEGGIALLGSTASQPWGQITAMGWPTLNAWHHIVATYDAVKGGDLYIDGVAVGVHLGGTGPLITNANPLKCDIWEGASVDELAMYPFALTADQVRAHHALGRAADAHRGIGRYTPGHRNCIPGWRIGIPVRFGFNLQGAGYKYKWRGHVVDIQPTPGEWLSRHVQVSCADWFERAASSPITAVPVATNKRSDLVMRTVLDQAVGRSPAAVDIQVGAAIFQYALDAGQGDHESILTEGTRVTNSERGYWYHRGDDQQGGTMRWEGRRYRQTEGIATRTLDNTMQGLQVDYSLQRVINIVRVLQTPRRVDASTVVLFTLEISSQPQPIAPGETVFFRGSYRDPEQLAARVGGADLVPLVAYTDYACPANADGTGADLTPSVALVQRLGASEWALEFTNGSALPCYLRLNAATAFQIRGRGIYHYSEIVVERRDETSIRRHGPRTLQLQAEYESDRTTADGIAGYVLKVLGDQRPLPRSVTLHGARGDVGWLSYCWAIEPGDRIALREPMTGVEFDDPLSFYDMGYWVNGEEGTFEENGRVTCTWTLAPSASMPAGLFDFSGFDVDFFFAI